MPTTIAHNSRETIKKLIRKEFDANPKIWQQQTANELIQTAKDFGLTDLAQQMQNDLQ